MSLEWERDSALRTDRLWEDYFTSEWVSLVVSSRPEMLIPAQGAPKPAATYITVAPLTTKTILKRLRDYSSWEDCQTGHTATVQWVRMLDDDLILKAVQRWEIQ